MTDQVPFGGRDYGVLLALLLVGRGADFLSTWVATPTLLLEANPLARRMGWKGGAVVNLLACCLCALWPLPAIVVTTTSLLVAARNFQSAWLMRTMGEYRYQAWMVERVQETHLGLYLFCILAQTLLPGAIGAALVWFSGHWLIPLAIGMGIITYAFAVAFYTLLSVWRLYRSRH